ncbi:MAG: uracil-DNA glycosylase [Bacteroidia bacterium]|nr:uracil-DNA glycosylase [Bacteroidia bacterium]
MSDVTIHPSWRKELKQEFDSSYFQNLTQFLKQRKTKGAIIYPPGNEIFNAFDLTPFEEVKVVILGQDPYHGEGEAHGLCFSVTDGTRIPPSLRNIFKELHADIGCEIPSSGNLSKWAKQGVFLLNSILTVEQKSPASHKAKGWEMFTDAVMKTISDKKNGVVFILWGAYAKSKKGLIDEKRHLVLEAPHPAAEIYAGGKAGFFGSRPFSKANDYLKNPIKWDLL